MIIMSQDEKQIINFDKIIGIMQKDTEVMIRLENVDLTIGKYETISRSMEILQEIMISYNSNKKVYIMPKEWEE